jgi:hypothetical protein
MIEGSRRKFALQWMKRIIARGKDPEAVPPAK